MARLQVQVPDEMLAYLRNRAELEHRMLHLVVADAIYQAYPELRRYEVERAPIPTVDGAALVPAGEYMAVIDEADAGLVGKYRWHYFQGHAARTINGRDEHGRRWSRKIYIEHLILGVPPGASRILFLDGNRLNCRRQNLVVRGY